MGALNYKTDPTGQEKSGRVGGERLLCVVVIDKSILIGSRMSMKLTLSDRGVKTTVMRHCNHKNDRSQMRRTSIYGW